MRLIPAGGLWNRIEAQTRDRAGSLLATDHLRRDEYMDFIHQIEVKEPTEQAGSAFHQQVCPSPPAQGLKKGLEARGRVVSGAAQYFAARRGQQVTLPRVGVLCHRDQYGRFAGRLGQLAIGAQAGRAIKYNTRGLPRAGPSVRDRQPQPCVDRP